MPCVKAKNAKTTKGMRRVSSGQARRRALAKKCGQRAFLLKKGSELKFPVMPEKDGCCFDCRMIRMAKQRASQHGYKSVIAKADTLGRKLGCRWAKDKKKGR